MPEQATVGMVGLGRMAQALVRGWLDLPDLSLRWVAYDPNPDVRAAAAQDIPEARLEWMASNADLARRADLIILAVKPAHGEAACRELRSARSHPAPLVLSVVAGIRLARLSQWLGHDRIVRVMPNTPCLVQRGAGAYAVGAGVGAEDLALTRRLLDAIGTFHGLPEYLLDAVTGLSGSGPAFVFVMIEALADAGVAAGLSRRVALDLAARTLEGAAAMVSADGPHPAELKDRVASPAGTTIAGLEQLEHHGVRAGLMAAVRAAARRAEQLGSADAPATCRVELQHTEEPDQQR